MAGHASTLPRCLSAGTPYVVPSSTSGSASPSVRTLPNVRNVPIGRARIEGRERPERPERSLPVGRGIVLQKLSPHMTARVEAADDRIHDAGGAVHDVEGRLEALL